MKLRFQVTGMTCAACSARVERVVSAIPGVSQVEVNLLAGKMTLQAESAQLEDAIVKAVADAGYQAIPDGKKTTVPKQDDAMNQMKIRVIASAFFLAILMYFTMGHMVGLSLPGWYHGEENALVAALLQFFLTLPVIYLNRVYFSRGLKALWNRAPNMDSLIAVGSLASIIYGVAALFRMSWAMGHSQWEIVAHYSKNLYFESAAMILTLITLGKFLETRAKGKTGDAIRQLMDLSPKTAVVLRDGAEMEIPVEQVVVGDTIVVRSGGSIPVDGTILEGRGAVDQSSLTGESVPVEKGVGDAVAAATINTEGYFLFRADKVGEDTTLAQVIRLVEEAGGSKAPIARLADKIAEIFVPVVMTLAAITFLVWMLVGKGLEFSLTTGIAVLVISCPCALGLATPVAIMVATGRGASMGVLFKNAEALENLHRIDTVVLDKTGTITQGKPAVTDVFPNGISSQELLRIASALEAKSEHPFARAILAAYGGQEILPSTGFETLAGRGVTAMISGSRCYGGNRKLMEEQGIHVPEFAQLSQCGKTPLYFGMKGGKFLGAIVAADVLKPDSAAAVSAMKSLGLNVVMLTGDNGKTAAAIARSAGIDQVIADVLPGDKAAQVEKLRQQGHRVLMVGDGINDAPALMTADVGMAIGAGTDIAVESADVVLMNSSLAAVSSAIALSNATIRNIRQNLFWAFFYNCLGIPVAAGVLYPLFGILLSPMLGAAAMSMSSVFVVTNALRLRMFKPKAAALTGAPAEDRKIKEEMNMETIIRVEGMMCTHCKARVEKVCQAVAGVTGAVVDLEKKQVTVSGDPDVNTVKQAITDAGYDVIE